MNARWKRNVLSFFLNSSVLEQCCKSFPGGRAREAKPPFYKLRPSTTFTPYAMHTPVVLPVAHPTASSTEGRVQSMHILFKRITCTVWSYNKTFRITLHCSHSPMLLTEVWYDEWVWKRPSCEWVFHLCRMRNNHRTDRQHQILKDLSIQPTLCNGTSPNKSCTKLSSTKCITRL